MNSYRLQPARKTRHSTTPLGVFFVFFFSFLRVLGKSRWEKIVQLGVHEAPLYHEHEHMYHQLMPADSRWRLLRFPIPVEFDRQRQEKLKNLFA